jgi:glycosyltransferase involved in cell wall biosynthesis
LKILYLSPAGNLGGAERVLLDMLASLRQAAPDWQLEVIAASPGPLVEEAAKLGAVARILRFPRALAALGDAAAGGPAGGGHGRSALAARVALALPATALYLKRLRGAIKRSAPSLVHSNGFKMHLLGARATPARIPVIWHLHDFLTARPLMPRLLASRAARCAAAIAVSHSVAEDARRALGAAFPLTTIHNAIDLRRFTPEGPRLDLDRLADWQAAADGTVKIGLVATMARWKGHEVFLRAIALLPSALRVRAYVIGGPLYETGGSQYSVAELNALAGQYGLGGRACFTGFIADMPAALRALDVVVHASTEPEPFGLVIVEAMACGRAVIASSAGGAAEIVTEGADALTHQPGDHVTLARLITRLAEDHELRRRLGRAAAQTASCRFGRERLASALGPIYMRLAADKALAMMPELNRVPAE